MKPNEYSCNSISHHNRRTFLKAAGASGLCFLTPLSQALARHAERKDVRAKSVILLWLEGAPSQLETFDPHPGTEIAAGSKAIKTPVPEIMLGDGLAQTAEQAKDFSLVRAITSKEGDHERAIYNIKTGFRPDPTLVHPAIGSVICHQTESIDGGIVEIPRHISILSGKTAGRGGYLGDAYDAFKIYDPKNKVPDVVSSVSDERMNKRLSRLKGVIESEYSKGRVRRAKNATTPNNGLTDAAIKMMASDQLKAFDLSKVPDGLKNEFGDTEFGRGCLAAMRLIETGVRCVEVTLNGWDSHVNNHELQAGRINILDPALAALLKNLKSRELLDSTIVLCGGEFGRTPTVNPAGGRDHWPHGFSCLLAGGGIAGGRVIGETSPTPKLDPKNRDQDIKDKVRVEDVHATILHSLGIDFEQELQTPVKRPMIISEGEVIKNLLV